MSKYWSTGVADLVPYVPGEQPRIANLIKLNTNENPYGPSPKALAAMRAALSDDLRLYPDPESQQLSASLAAGVGLSADQVFVGNGSDEVLAHAFFAFFRQRLPILMPDVSYSFYPVYCQLYGIAHESLALDAELALDLSAYHKPNGGIVFANPNAPTGRALSLPELEALLDANPDSVVLVDEAYVDFGADSAVSLVPRYPQLLVLQTFSKSRSLAGLRVGMAFGQAHLIEALNRVKNSFNSYPMDRVAQAGALAAWEDREWFDTTRTQVMTSRTHMVNGLEALGYKVLPSAANFVFACHPQRTGAEVAAALRADGILVRHFAKPRISDYLRITVGTDAQVEALLKSLAEQN